MDDLAAIVPCMTSDLEPGTDGRPGVITERSYTFWTRVGEGYVPVRVIRGDRINGGYRPETLAVKS